MEVFKEFRIEAAHRLPHVPEGHKCARLHGHSFRIRIVVSAPVEPERGWVLDFADIAEAFQPVFRTIDHQYLNEIEGLENPTSENLARYVWDRMVPLMPNLRRVEVFETCTSGCVYDGREF